VATRVSRERHGLAGSIAAQVRQRAGAAEPLAARLWRWSIAPVTGMPVLLLVLALLFAVLFQVGTVLEEAIDALWGAFATPAIDAVLTTIVGRGAVADVLRWGFDAGILAILSVGIPYVLVFYFMLAFLEDSGYLSSVAFLLDNVMHRFGLHGRSAIPLVAAAGCNVPGIMAVRTLGSLRERLIASTLVVLVPCTARTAVIVGVVGHYAGLAAAVGLIAFVGLIAVASGLALNRILPGTSTGLVMEMFPFRVPSPLTVARKTWYRFHDFVFVALPIVVGGSLVLGLLYETGYIWLASAPLGWVIEGWLGLPTVAGLCLIFAVLRKELAMQLLVAVAIVQYGPQSSDLLQFMNVDQIFVYALVNTIYMPCLATLAVLQRELGTRRVVWIAGATVVLALVAGGLAIRVLGLF
jgi:ferrous iron transport protein B